MFGIVSNGGELIIPLSIDIVAMDAEFTADVTMEIQIADVAQATEVLAGKSRFATDAEAPAGQLRDVAIHPAGLAAALRSSAQGANTGRRGVVELATNNETQAGNDQDRAVTPAGMKSVTATANRRGLVELATNAEAETGTDSVRAITPAALRVVLSLIAVLQFAANSAHSWDVPFGRAFIVAKGGDGALLGRDAAKDIALGVAIWSGGLSDGTTGWFVNDTADMAVAYRLSDQSRDAAKDIALGLGLWRDGLSDGTTGWFVNDTADMAVAYRLSDQSRDAAKDIALGGAFGAAGLRTAPPAGS